MPHPSAQSARKSSANVAIVIVVIRTLVIVSGVSFQTAFYASSQKKNEATHRSVRTAVIVTDVVVTGSVVNLVDFMLFAKIKKLDLQ